MPFKKEAVVRPERDSFAQFEDVDAYYSSLAGANDVREQNAAQLPDSSANIFNISRQPSSNNRS